MYRLYKVLYMKCNITFEHRSYNTEFLKIKITLASNVRSRNSTSVYFQLNYIIL